MCENCKATEKGKDLADRISTLRQEVHANGGNPTLSSFMHRHGAQRSDGMPAPTSEEKARTSKAQELAQVEQEYKAFHNNLVRDSIRSAFRK